MIIAETKVDVTYLNTPEVAEQLMYNTVSDYCFGDTSAKYVIHNHVLGTFFFEDTI